jgi:hypothetical protein
MSADNSLSSESASTLSAENFSVIFVAIIVLILVFVGTTSGRDNQRCVCGHTVCRVTLFILLPSSNFNLLIIFFRKNKLRSLPRPEIPISATLIKPRVRPFDITSFRRRAVVILSLSAYFFERLIVLYRDVI